MTWREMALDVINQVVRDHPDLSGADLRKVVEANYPFGQRAWHPYKVWRKCVTDVLGPSDRQRAAWQAKLSAINAKSGQASLKEASDA